MNRELSGSFSERRKFLEDELERKRKRTESISKSEKDGTWRWAFYDSEFSEFEYTFAPLFPEREGMKNYVQNFLSDSKGKAVGIELGGPGSKLFAGFDQGFFGETLGVTLTDIRDEEQTLADKRINHSVLAGNIFETDTKKKIAKFLGNRKVDFIIERMLGGTSLAPASDKFAAMQIKYWYSQLNEPGLMLLEFTNGIASPVTVKEWTDFVNANYKGKIELDFCDESHLRLSKLPGSPKELPLLNELDYKTSW